MPTAKTATPEPAPAPDVRSYEVPIVHARVPQRVGNAAFWLGLVGVVAAGAVELPLAALVGAGVVVARHGRRG